MTISERMDNLENALNEIKTMLLNNSGKDVSQDVSSVGNKCLHKELIPHHELIDEVMDNFNFNKVHKVMTFLDWKWISPKGVLIPTIDEVKEEARRLLVDAVTKHTTIASGGFKARFENSPDGEEPFIGLEFIIEDFSNY